MGISESKTLKSCDNNRELVEQHHQKNEATEEKQPIVRISGSHLREGREIEQSLQSQPPQVDEPTPQTNI